MPPSHSSESFRSHSSSADSALLGLSMSSTHSNQSLKSSTSSSYYSCYYDDDNNGNNGNAVTVWDRPPSWKNLAFRLKWCCHASVMSENSSSSSSRDQQQQQALEEKRQQQQQQQPHRRPYHSEPLELVASLCKNNNNKAQQEDQNASTLRRRNTDLPKTASTREVAHREGEKKDPKDSRVRITSEQHELSKNDKESSQQSEAMTKQQQQQQLPPKPPMTTRRSSVASVSSRQQQQHDRPPLATARGMSSASMGLPPPPPPLPPPPSAPQQQQQSRQQQAARPRLDSNQTNQTNSSRHRRSSYDSFAFSVDSLQQIHKQEQEPRLSIATKRSSTTTGGLDNSWSTLPMGSISVDRAVLDRDCSELLVDLDTDELENFCRNYDNDDESLLLSTDEEEEEEEGSDDDDDNGKNNGADAATADTPSPTTVVTDPSGPNKKSAMSSSAPPTWMLEWATTTSTNTANANDELVVMTPPKKQAASPMDLAAAAAAVKSTSSPVVPQDVVEPVYLPRHDDDDDDQQQKADADVVLSLGWMAMSTSDRLLALTKQNKNSFLDRSVLVNVQVVKSDDGGMMVLQGRRDGVVIHEIPLSGDCRISSKDVSTHFGRAAVIEENGSLVCTMLPVSLPDFFFEEKSGELFSDLSQVKSAMVTPFRAQSLASAGSSSASCSSWGPNTIKRYAPDAQHDAVMHLVFSLDALLRTLRY